MKCTSVRTALLPNIEKILFDFIFPLTFFNKDDEEVIEDNPTEYLRRNEQGFAGNDLKEAALEVVLRFAKEKRADGKQNLYSLLDFISNFLKSGKNPRNAELEMTVITKEALFHMLDNLAYLIGDYDDLVVVVEEILQNYVCQELNNEHAFMKMRACSVVNNFFSKNLNSALLKNLSTGICNCMGDKNLAVQVTAALSLEKLLSHDDLKSHFSANLKDILMQYFKLMNESENDILIDSLQKILSIYRDEISVYALDLITSLNDLFFKLSQKETKLSLKKDAALFDEMEESCMASVSCITAMQEILCADLSQDVLVSCFEQIQNMLIHSLSKTGDNYTDAALELLNRIIYNAKPLTEKMWVLFPVMCYYTCGSKNFNMQNRVANVDPEISGFYDRMMVNLSDWPSGLDEENMMRLSVIFKNFMSNGSDQLLQRQDIFGTPFLQLLSTTISAFIGRCNEGEDALEDASICFTLVGSMFSSFTNPQLDQYLVE